MRLRDIVGHDAVIRALSGAQARESGHHAYLLQGPDGVGKRRVAFGLAALVNCTAPEQVGDLLDACGTCRHCRRILAMADDPEAPKHPDLIVLEPDGKQIKVAQVREVLRMAPFPPIEAATRFILVTPADGLGEEAANALLKTLEEPPSRTRFILITSRPAALLTTIKSRCQRVRLGRLSDEALQGVLVSRHDLEPALAARLVSVADGSVGDALSLIEDPVMAERERLMTRFMDVKLGDELAAFELAGLVGELGAGRDTFFDLLQRLLRDALMLRLGVPNRLFHADLAEAIGVWAVQLGAGALEARLALLAETRLGLATFHTNPKLTLERLMIALTATPGREGVRPILPHTEIL